VKGGNQNATRECLKEESESSRRKGALQQGQVLPPITAR